MINAANGLSATGSTSTAKPKSPLNSNSDFTTFLKMLTTQMQNQDPLNPVEANDFAVQLATFSSVEQQTKTNQLLASLLEKGDGLSETAGWIGKEAGTSRPVWFGEGPIDLDIKPKPNADKVILSAINDKGVVVYSERIGADGGEGEWYGVNKAGEKLPDGKYTFKISSFRDDVHIGDSNVPAYARIVGTRRGEKGIELIFPGDISAKVSEIKTLREAGA